MVLDSPFAMLIMWGPQLVQVYNEGYVGIFGDKHPCSLGQPAHECWADIWDEVGPLLRGVYERGEAVYFENLPLKMTRNGRFEEAYFTFSYSPIRDGESVAGVICIVNETTAHVLRERETVERAEALTALDRAKTQFFSNVSHEFRTPLTLMLGPLEELVRTLPEYEQRQTADLARRNAQRLQKLVNTLLDFAAAQSGVIHAVATPVAVDALTADIASEFRSAYERAGLTLTVDAGANATIALDRVMYEKVLLNLLSNALKFTFSGGVTVTTRIVDGEFVLRVVDTGIGIEPEHQQTLFDRFSRVDGAASRTHEGSGIGLALAKELVELQKGSIRVESHAGRGSTFIVRLPAKEMPLIVHDSAPDTAWLRRQFREEADGFTRPVDPAISAEAPPHAPSVLIADDNADLRGYLARLLGSRYHVRVAQDGADVLRLAEASTPDLIVADVMMPNVNGFEALERLRMSPRTAKTPIVLLSARAGEEASSEAFARGADDYVVKPFIAADLIARIDALLRRTRPSGLRIPTDELYAGISSDMADRFISAVNVQAVWEAVVQTLTPGFAEWSSVSVVDADGTIVPAALRHAQPAKTELGHLINREYPERIGNGSVAAAVFETGQPVLLPEITPEQIRDGARDARHAAIMLALELRSAMVVPVLVDATPVASISVVRAEGATLFTQEDLYFLERLAARTALAYENARAQERERTIATTLQRALLPSALPTIAGLRFSASYSPASQETLVGGDWYDAFAGTGDRVVISIGDVVGHGFDAATVMATLRQSVRSLALRERDPGEMLAHLNRVLLAEGSGRMATAFIAVVEPQTLAVRVASAGHSCAVRISADGDASTLAAEGLLLGVDDEARYESRDYQIQPGDLVALYTDGFIEEERDLERGEARFIKALAASRHAADPATAVHLEIFGGAAPRDDAALLTLSAEPVLSQLDIRIPAVPAMAAHARVAVRRFLEGTSLPAPRRFELLLAAGEATINAIEHAYSGRQPGTIRITGHREGDVVTLDVEDDGLGWDVTQRDPSQRGYGLPLMYAFSDGVDIDRSASGTRVRLTARSAVLA